MSELVAGLVADLQAESAELDALVAGLDDAGWHTPTPAEGWDIADTIAHLGSTDDAAHRAATDGAAFTRWLQDVVAPDIQGYLDRQVDPGRELSPADLLAWWRAGRTALTDVLPTLDPAVKLPWFGPPMSPASFATARIMETWAHGCDVADALGVRRTPTARLRHVAEIGFRTRNWSFIVNDRPVPDAALRLELEGPDGQLFTWGPEDAPDRVRGSLEDFCLLVTQRLHRSDAELAADGPTAESWLAIAQAYAGPPGPGRKPRE